MPFFEDYYLWIRMIKNDCKFYNIQEPLVSVRGGQEMINRRGGAKYIRATARFQKALRASGIIGFGSEIANIASRSLVALLPDSFRNVFYSKMLRRR